MEFTETPSVEGGVDRRIVFPKIKWLTKPKFEQLIDDIKNRNTEQILEPFINNTINHQYKYLKHDVDKRVYIGKTIPKSTKNLLSDSIVFPFESSEVIGNVYKTDEKLGSRWMMKVTHNGYVFDIDDNFLILSIDDAASYFWSSNVDLVDEETPPIYFQFNIKEIPKYALRASVDKDRCEYNYVGRTLDNEVQNCRRPKFFSNGKHAT